MSSVSEQYSVKFLLNTALCQSPPEVSKTKKAIEYIKHFSVLSRGLCTSEDGVHHMTIVLTNNSLVEAEQWSHRLKKSMTGKGMNICVLSSKKGATFNSLANLITRMVNAKNANYLPDLIVMCTHSKRTEDVVELLNTLKTGNLNFTKIRITRISLTVMFDEADKNIELIADFLKRINLQMGETDDKRVDSVLRNVHFITGTAYAQFWKKLVEIGITTLSNINRELCEMDAESVLHLPQSELMKGYRRIEEHMHRSNIEIDTNNPVEAATHMLLKIREDVPTRVNKRVIVFVPAGNTIKSHEDMRDIFLLADYTVLVLNGKDKVFYSKKGNISVDDFKRHYDIKGELKDVLVKWAEVNPEENLAITGNRLIERGITFCTSGFNFTDFIISKYHMKDIASLVQLLGRANGGKEYVSIMNIWAPKEVISAANEQIEIVNSLLNSDPEEFKEKDFRKMTKREELEPAMTVPIIIQLSNEEYTTLQTYKKGRSWDADKIQAMLESKRAGLKTELLNHKKYQISEPSEGPSVKKHIEAPILAAADNRKYTIDIKPDLRDKDLYQMFLDKTGYRIIVSIYNGTKLGETITHVE